MTSKIEKELADVGLWACVDHSPELSQAGGNWSLLAMHLGPAFLEIRADKVKRVSDSRKESSKRFRGSFEEEKEGLWSVTSKADWQPSAEANGLTETDYLLIDGIESISIQRMPDNQPSHKKMTLYEVSDEHSKILAQGFDIEYRFEKSNLQVQTGVFGIPRLLFTALGSEPPLKALFGKMGVDIGEK